MLRKFLLLAIRSSVAYRLSQPVHGNSASSSGSSGHLTQGDPAHA